MQQALQDTGLLRDALRSKEAFYRSGFSHCDRCMAGEMTYLSPRAIHHNA